MVTLHMLPLLFLRVLSASILQVELKLQHNFKRNKYNLASNLAPIAAAKWCTNGICCSLACQVSTVSLSAAQHVYLCLFTSTRICWISHNCVCLQGHRDSFFPFHCNPTKTVSDTIEDPCKRIISIRVHWVMVRSASTQKLPLGGLGYEVEGSRSDITLKMFWQQVMYWCTYEHQTSKMLT